MPSRCRYFLGQNYKFRWKRNRSPWSFTFSLDSLMYYLLNKALKLLEQMSKHFSAEQQQEFNNLKEAVLDYYSSNFDNYNYD